MMTWDNANRKLGGGVKSVSQAILVTRGHGDDDAGMPEPYTEHSY